MKIEGFNASAESTNMNSNNPPPANKKNNIQLILARKQQFYNLPQVTKLLKLANYSACQAEECKCKSWKKVQSIVISPNNEAQPPPAFNDPCRNCNHSLENHFSHLIAQSEETINKLLGMVVDVHNIFEVMHAEEDPVAKRNYSFLFKLFKKNIFSMTEPKVEGPMGQPPFEQPNISQAVTNFLIYRFGHLAEREWQSMYDSTKMFLHCLNNWNFEAPGARGASADDASAYKINYTRWHLFCYIPAFCDSLPQFDTTAVFGKTFLRGVFKSVRKELIEKSYSERNGMSADERTLLLAYFPMFLMLLEAEIYSESSPIWNSNFKPVRPAHPQMSVELLPVED